MQSEIQKALFRFLNSDVDFISYDNNHCEIYVHNLITLVRMLHFQQQIR